MTKQCLYDKYQTQKLLLGSVVVMWFSLIVFFCGGWMGAWRAGVICADCWVSVCVLCFTLPSNMMNNYYLHKLFDFSIIQEYILSSTINIGWDIINVGTPISLSNNTSLKLQANKVQVYLLQSD